MPVPPKLPDCTSVTVLPLTEYVPEPPAVVGPPYVNLMLVENVYVAPANRLFVDAVYVPTSTPPDFAGAGSEMPSTVCSA